MTNAYGVPEWATWVPELTGSSDARAARIRRAGALLMAATLLTAASAAAVSLLKDDGPVHPEAWDPQVQELVDFVEAERGLSFAQPVYVDFLSDADFEARFRADLPAGGASAQSVGPGIDVLRALGLIEGKAGAGALVDPVAGGYYSYADERIWVRGTELTSTVQSTLVRELAHALQDQHFDLGTRLDKVMGEPDAATALNALVDVDADRVEASWRRGLDRQERMSIEASAGSPRRQVATAPTLLQAEMSAPYVLAGAALSLAAQTGGDEAVGELFRRPPTTEEHALDAWTLVADHAVPIGTAWPALARGEKELGHGSFGAVSWLLVLAERLPPEQALTAADGWGGDAYVAFTRDEASCVRIDYRGDTSQDVREMRMALVDWSAAAPVGSAVVRRSGTLLTLESCALGAAGPTTTGPRDALAMAANRTDLSGTLVDHGWSPARARCGADLLVRALTPEELKVSRLDGTRIHQLTASCED